MAGRHHKRHLGILDFVLISFFLVSGGPQGVEDVARAAGPGWALLGFVVFPICYSVPQSLMTAELSSMMPEDGGYVIWVERSMGPFWGWINSYNSALCNLFDNSTYPALFGAYMAQALPWSPEAVYVSQVLMVLFCVYCNVVGLKVVAKASVILSVLVIVPYAILFGMRVSYIDPSTQWTFNDIDKCDWSLFFATIIWFHTGWDGVGTFAGEVSKPSRTYPIGLFFVNLMIMILYISPLIAGFTFLPFEQEKWHEGYLTKIAYEAAPWLSAAVLLSSCIAVVGIGLNNVVESSRALWAMGSEHRNLGRQLPAIFNFTWERFDTPAFAICFQGVVMIVLMNQGFKFLLIMDSIANGVSLLLEFAAFLVLRYREPHAFRPFKVPGGMWGAWLITVPKFIIISGIFFTYELEYLLMTVAFNIGAALLFAIIKWDTPVASWFNPDRNLHDEFTYQAVYPDYEEHTPLLQGERG